MAPLQKRAWYGLIIGIVFTIAIITVFIVKGGVATFNEDLGFRVIVDVLWVGMLVANLFVVNLIIRKQGQVDERDKFIVVRATKVQLLAVIFSLVVWMIGLTEIYWDQGAIPIVFPYLILMSTLIVSTLAQSIGILIGYWRGALRV